MNSRAVIMTTLPFWRREVTSWVERAGGSRCQTEARRWTGGPSSVGAAAWTSEIDARRAAATEGPPPRVGRSGSMTGRRRNGPDSPHARRHTILRIGLSGARGGEPLGGCRGAVLTAGRGQRRATAGARREAARRAGAFPDAVTISAGAILSVSVAATPA